MILAKAHEEQRDILNEAVETRERYSEGSQTQAQVKEGQKLLDEAKKKQIQAEKTALSATFAAK